MFTLRDLSLALRKIINFDIPVGSGVIAVLLQPII
jgi:hypothetical protein